MDRVLRTVCVVAAVVALCPALLAAQSPEQRVDDALRRAAETGVPVELLESKVAEGRAKGIPMERIAEAVERRFEVLGRVHLALGERHELSVEELGVAADAAQAGVSEAVLASLAESAPRERRAVAIAALTQLVQLGYASETALERVSEALARGPEALMNLPAQAAGRGAGAGGPPGEVGPGAAGGRGGPPASVTPQGVPPGRGRADPGGRGGPPGGGPPGGGGPGSGG